MKLPCLDTKPIASLIAAIASTTCLTATAQTKSAADGIAEHRKMLEDGNPAELSEARK